MVVADYKVLLVAWSCEFHRSLPTVAEGRSSSFDQSLEILEQSLSDQSKETFCHWYPFWPV